ncbi:MAG TPA: proton-conducting transporter membrane subunit [Syntrophobacteria bacterium]|nr:proton-conducting transporter membrane subunit [Syntrophobacteria bacterium]
MVNELSTILVLLPFVSAVLIYLIRVSAIRSLIVLVTGAVLIVCSLLLIPYAPFSWSPHALLGVPLHGVVQVADFALLLIILYFGYKHRNLVIQVLSVLQIATMVYLEFFMVRGPISTDIFYCDNLSLIMVLVASIVGSLICFQAIPYMKKHEHHLHLEKSKQPQFFFVMILFLGAMNGVVLANDMTFFYFFFELTTLCSFLLIGHDATEIATKNAVRALWMNSLGGAAFAIALVFIYSDLGHLDMQQVIRTGPVAGLYVLPVALLVFSAFTKSAQFPFQSWLLGAMVAPTPVSALLHSSTMVKVGVYFALRLAPAIQLNFLSQTVAVFGAFSFLAAAALAIGQSNGKKVLAYSTISNLGLIFACAGINTPEAITAGILLIMFHAVVKALLFLCVGTIEQSIDSRDIEDMRGVYGKMPVTALITVMGVLMMIMPPFGVLLSKWMAMEAAARNIYAIIMIGLGSALTVMYWARWAGTLMSDPFAGRFKAESQPVLTWFVLLGLCVGCGVMSFAIPWLYALLVVPALGGAYVPPFTVREGILESGFGSFPIVPLCIVAAFGFLVSIWAVRRAARARIVSPYLSGAQTSEVGTFRGPMNQPVKAWARNYYLNAIFGEERLTVWVNLSAGVLLALMMGGVL